MQTWFLIGLPNQAFASPWWPSKVSLFKMSPVLPSIICEIWPSSHHSPLTICEIRSFLMALSLTLVTFSLHFLPCPVIPHGNFIELNLMACPSHLSVYLHKLGERRTAQSHKWWLSDGHWRNDVGKRIRQEDSETLCEQEDVAGWSTDRKDNPQKHENKDGRDRLLEERGLWSPSAALKCDEKEQNWEMGWQERRITILAKGADATPAVRSDYLRSKRRHIGTKREGMMI